ncbi:MAG: hypothetical protein KAR11_05815 [Phycisphaerae bacterium]|nr:hypothetical protein [Phycisphaerae bacterium]
MKITFSHFSHIIIAAILFGASFAGIASVMGASDAPVQLEDLAKTKPADSDNKNTSDEDSPLTAADDELKPAPIPTTKPADESDTTAKPIAGISDDEIRQLRERGEVPVTKPKSVTHKRRTGKITRKFIPTPGSMVINQTATVSKHPEEHWMVAKFEADSPTYQLVDMKILPCRLLESIEEIIAKKPDTRFVLSGEITVCKEKVVVDNKEVTLELVYLLPTRVTIAKAPEPKDESKTSTTKPTDPNQDVATTDLIGKMQTGRTLGTAVLVRPAKTRDAAENQESVAPAGKKPFESGKKTLVIDRIVRIKKKDKQGWWEVRFKSDNTLREPPMRILPNKTFEEARGMTQTLGTRDLELRISGIVTHYKGRRYLIIRKVLPERDMNEF